MSRGAQLALEQLEQPIPVGGRRLRQTAEESNTMIAMSSRQVAPQRYAFVRGSRDGCLTALRCLARQASSCVARPGRGAMSTLCPMCWWASGVP